MNFNLLKQSSPGEAAFRDWSEVMPVGKFAETLNAIRNPTDMQSYDCGSKLNATLRPYQKTGVRWLCLMSQLGLGACLADDMGFGKTIQVIAVLLAGGSNCNLLVAPASLLGNRESEIKKFAPSLKTYIVHSSGAGTDKPKSLDNTALVMTTYGMVERLDWLKKQHWQTVILDEAQAI